jgi:hypothetical protein
MHGDSVVFVTYFRCIETIRFKAILKLALKWLGLKISVCPLTLVEGVPALIL